MLNTYYYLLSTFIIHLLSPLHGHPPPVPSLGASAGVCVCTCADVLTGARGCAYANTPACKVKVSPRRPDGISRTRGSHHDLARLERRGQGSQQTTPFCNHFFKLVFVEILILILFAGALLRVREEVLWCGTMFTSSHRETASHRCLRRRFLCWMVGFWTDSVDHSRGTAVSLALMRS